MKEAIAVVGIGLRFPGKLDSADALTAFLAERRSAICDVPADRWDKDAFFHPDFRRLGRISVTRGGFLESIANFDAAFFGISPHEARRMDPQQRLVLETCFEAIEDAGMPLDRLRGRFVPVTIGAGLRDYDSVLGAVSDRVNIGATTNTGQRQRRQGQRRPPAPTPAPAPARRRRRAGAPAGRPAGRRAPGCRASIRRKRATSRRTAPAPQRVIPSKRRPSARSSGASARTRSTWAP